MAIAVFSIFFGLPLALQKVFIEWQHSIIRHFWIESNKFRTLCENISISLDRSFPLLEELLIFCINCVVTGGFCRPPKKSFCDETIVLEDLVDFMELQNNLAFY